MMRYPSSKFVHVVARLGHSYDLITSRHKLSDARNSPLAADAT